MNILSIMNFLSVMNILNIMDFLGNSLNKPAESIA